MCLSIAQYNELIKKKLAEIGLDETVKIEYINTYRFPDEDDIEIVFNPKTETVIIK